MSVTDWIAVTGILALAALLVAGMGFLAGVLVMERAEDREDDESDPEPAPLLALPAGTDGPGAQAEVPGGSDSGRGESDQGDHGRGHGEPWRATGRLAVWAGLERPRGAQEPAGAAERWLSRIPGADDYGTGWHASAAA